MNDGELIGKVHSAMYHQCQNQGYAAPVDVLMDIGVLPKQKYEDWRFGRVPYLEAVCTVNLRKLSFIMHQMRVYAQKAGLKKGDIIISCDGETVETMEGLSTLLDSMEAGTSVQIGVMMSVDGGYQERILEVMLDGNQ